MTVGKEKKIRGTGITSKTRGARNARANQRARFPTGGRDQRRRRMFVGEGFAA